MPAAKRSLDLYVEQTFSVQCHGRGLTTDELFSPPIDVTVKIYKIPGSNTISSEVNCPYNRGGHGEYCGAIEAINVDKERALAMHIPCAYAFELPR